MDSDKHFEPVIGLEVHVQLDTASKLFCPCPVEFGREPNSLICPVCTGQPGVLPVLNREALNSAIVAGLMLDCAISPVTRFDRKNYFYPDLPKGYQITQFAWPVAEHGSLEIGCVGRDGNRQDGGERTPSRRIEIKRVHLEEDAGKTIHRDDDDLSLIDLNRAGVPLLEIVSEPQITSPAEAYAYLTALKRLMRYCRVSECDMEKGSLRCDANVSLRLRDARELGTRTEIKNLNSFKNVEKALAFEIDRQRRVLIGGGRVDQETRMWRETEGQTAGMRSKEESHDYRYLLEPDLPAFPISEALREELRARTTEKPFDRQRRFISSLGLSPSVAAVLTAERDLADFFEACIAQGGQPGETANWILGPLLEIINDRGMRAGDQPLEAGQLVAVIGIVAEGKISRQAGRRVITAVIDSGRTVDAVIEELGLEQISNAARLEPVIDRVLESCATMVEDYRKGKRTVINALLGRIMGATRGKANPHVARKLLQEKLETL